MNKQVTVGIIGIGQSGLPIATNLIETGYTVVGFRRHDKEEFVQRGGRALASPSQVGREADVILLCLPSEDAQLDVLEGTEGLLPVLKPGQIIINAERTRANSRLHRPSRRKRAAQKCLRPR